MDILERLSEAKRAFIREQVLIPNVVRLGADDAHLLLVWAKSAPHGKRLPEDATKIPPGTFVLGMEVLVSPGRKDIRVGYLS